MSLMEFNGPVPGEVDEGEEVTFVEQLVCVADQLGLLEYVLVDPVFGVGY